MCRTCIIELEDYISRDGPDCPYTCTFTYIHVHVCNNYKFENISVYVDRSVTRPRI